MERMIEEQRQREEHTHKKFRQTSDFLNRLRVIFMKRFLIRQEMQNQHRQKEIEKQAIVEAKWQARLSRALKRRRIKAWLAEEEEAAENQKSFSQHKSTW